MNASARGCLLLKLADLIERDRIYLAVSTRLSVARYKPPEFAFMSDINFKFQLLTD